MATLINEENKAERKATSSDSCYLEMNPEVWSPCLAGWTMRRRQSEFRSKTWRAIIQAVLWTLPLAILKIKKKRLSEHTLGMIVRLPRVLHLMRQSRKKKKDHRSWTERGRWRLAEGNRHGRRWEWRLTSKGYHGDWCGCLLGETHSLCSTV